MKTDNNKELLLAQLKKTPVIQIACEKLGIARSTFYRWKKENKKFAVKADKALAEGTDLINDMAESQLISAIRDRNMTSIIFWLKTHKEIYSDKLKITGHVTTQTKLTKEQTENIRKALTLAFSVTKENHDKHKK
jgi:ACT domain-containing protein